MPGALEWTLSLIDKVSGPSKTAAASLTKVEASLKSLDASTGKASTSSVAASRAMSTMGSGASGAAAALGGIATAALTAGAALAAVGVGLGVMGAKYAGEMAIFKENTLFAFKYVTGSQAGAVALMDDADKLARSMGQKTSSVSTSIAGLMSRGFNQAEAEKVTAAMSDIGALNPNANVANLVEQMAQVRGLGKLQYEDLKPILQSGGPSKEINEELMKATGTKNMAELQKVMAAGKVSSEQGIAAILRAVQTKGGGKELGSVAAAFSKSTVTGAFQNMTAMVERLFMAINSGGAGSGLITLMNRISAAMDPTSESGQRLLAQMDKLVAMGGNLFDKIDASVVTGTVDTLVKSMETLLKTAQAALGALEMLGVIDLEHSNKNHQIEAYNQQYSDQLYRKRFGDAEANRREAADAAPKQQALAAIDHKYAPSIIANPDIADSITAMRDAEKAKWMEDNWRTIGQAGAAGLVDGLNGGAPAADAAGRSLAGASVTGARAALDVHSPSRVFAQLGAYTAIGFAEGVDANAGRAEASMSAMLTPPRASGFGAGSFGGAGAAGASVSIGDINVTVGPGAEADGEKIAVTIKRELTAIFDGLSLELGGGVALGWLTFGTETEAASRPSSRSMTAAPGTTFSLQA
jgi:hypothetical protein